MKAGEIVIDFINQLFTIALVVFVFVFIVLGDRLGAAYAIMQALAPLGFFGLFFVIQFRFSRDKIKKLRYEDRLNEVLFYLSDEDLFWDWFFCILIPITIFVMPIFFVDINSFDIVQFIFQFSILLFLHKVIFKKEGGYETEQYLTRFDEIIDEISLFFVPILIYALAFFFNSPNALDIVQTILVLVFGYAWHFFFFKLHKR